VPRHERVIVQVLIGVEGLPRPHNALPYPSYWSGVSKKTDPGKDPLIIVNGLVTIASLAARKEWICHSAANNAASVGPTMAKSHAIHGSVEGQWIAL
jgi:hypothetical protein